MTILPIIILPYQNYPTIHRYLYLGLRLTACLGKDDVFGEDLKKSYFDPRRTVSKSGYTVRAMSYSDMHRIRIDDLQSIMDSYSEFATDFLQKFGVTFNLKKVSLLS